MSVTADLLRQRVLARLTELRADKVNSLRRCKPRSAMVMRDGAVIAASTPDEIAMFAVDTNASIDALDIAINAINEEFRKLTSPEQPEDTAQAAANEDNRLQQARRPAYG